MKSTFKTPKFSTLAALPLLMLVLCACYFLINPAAKILVNILPEKTLNAVVNKPASEYLEKFVAPRHCTNPEGQKGLETLMKKMDIDPEKYRAYVLPDLEINAFAGPQQIFIHQGLLNFVESPEELAGILGHEVEHIEKKHHSRGWLKLLAGEYMSSLVFGSTLGSASSKKVGELLVQRFNQADESEADRGALERLKKGNISPLETRKFFLRMMKKEGSGILRAFSLTHPPDKERAETFNLELPGTENPLIPQMAWESLKKFCH